MDRPFVDRLRIQQYGCIQDVELKLTPIHALVGPNDSGKSTILSALRAAAWLAGANGLTDPDYVRRIDHSTIVVGVADLSWEASRAESLTREDRPIRRALRGAQLLRLDPDALREPSSLIQQGNPIRFQSDRGHGLPALYDALLSRNLGAFIEVREQLKALFPAVDDLELVNESSSTKALGIKVAGGRSVPAEHMSEGLLYFLAFAVLRHVEPTAILLVEEPENGLHPARIAEVMRVLREVAKTTQVLIATHSPLVVNELAGDEISVVTRDPSTGTKAVRLNETPEYADRSTIYSNGELWVSYSDGENEKALLGGGPLP